jgi:hypothetical protein
MVASKIALAKAGRIFKLYFALETFGQSIVKRGARFRAHRHSGAMRSIEPGISRFPDVQLHI